MTDLHRNNANHGDGHRNGVDLLLHYLSHAELTPTRQVMQQ